MKYQFSTIKIITAAALIGFGATGRYLLQDLPNIETITVVSLLAGSLLGGIYTVIVGLSVVAITDIAIGNTAILLYTWSAWAAMGAFGWVLRKRNKKPLRHSLELTGAGLAGTLFFYAWTNFGVWHLGGLYPHTVAGLLQSYLMGLPFLKYQLIGTLLIVPSVSFIALAAWNRLPAWLARRQATPLVSEPVSTDGGRD
jgi:hypothetical protein